MNSAEVSIRDRSVQDIHLEKAFTYLIDINLKIFAESVHVLSKISDQILMQPSASAIIMTAYNSSKSVYGKVTLSNNFFSHIDGTLDDIQQNEEGDVFCRIATRSALHIFKNFTSKSLSIPSFDSCQLELDPKADFAVIHLKQQFGAIQRAFILPMKEHTTSTTCENIFMERQRLKNQITSQPKMILNQLAGLDCRQVKFVVTPTQFSAHRYIIREEFSKVRKTEVTIPVDHFELYHIHLNTQIVISLKELRSVLYFADSCGMVVTLHFDRPGRPFIVAVEDTLEFKAQFVLATLDEGEPLTLTQQFASSSQTPQIQQQITPTIRNQMPRQSRIVQETPPQQLQQKQLSIRQRIGIHQEYSGSADENENRSPTHSALF